jgi:hypothetical protein
MASLKAILAAAKVAMQPGDGRCVPLHDKAILGAGFLGTPAVGDTIDYFVPAGTKVLDLAVTADDCDTGATFAGSWGYRPVSAADGALVANASYFMAAAAFAQAPGRTEFVFKPIVFEQDAYISFTVTVAPTGIAGNPEIHLIGICQAVGAK